MNQCPYCQATEQQIKSGLNASRSQRFRCRVCDRIYTPEPSINGYPDEVRNQAVKFYLEGMNLRMLGVVHQSVANWINDYHSSLPASTAPVQQPKTLEVDELFTLVETKKNRHTSSR